MDINNYLLSNGKTVADAEKGAFNKIKNIYQDAWQKGISIPFFDKDGNIILANPDGSEDLVSLNSDTRQYTIIKRIAKPKQGNRYKTLS